MAMSPQDLIDRFETFGIFLSVDERIDSDGEPTGEDRVRFVADRPIPDFLIRMLKGMKPAVARRLRERMEEDLGLRVIPARVPPARRDVVLSAGQDSSQDADTVAELVEPAGMVDSDHGDQAEATANPETARGPDWNTEPTPTADLPRCPKCGSSSIFQSIDDEAAGRPGSCFACLPLARRNSRILMLAARKCEKVTLKDLDGGWGG